VRTTKQKGASRSFECLYRRALGLAKNDSFRGLKALEEVGSIDSPDAVVDALLKMKYQGVAGSADPSTRITRRASLDLRNEVAAILRALHESEAASHVDAAPNHR
jgi:hypothetical protein